MSTSSSKTLLATAASTEVASLIATIRQEIASKTAPPSHAKGPILRVPSSVRPANKLISVLSNAAGSPPVCTMKELSDIADECCNSGFLVEARRIDWLRARLTKLLGQTLNRVIKASHFDFRLDQVIRARTDWITAFEIPVRQPLNQEGAGFDQWDPFEAPEEFALRVRFAVNVSDVPCSFLSLFVESKGMSAEAFDEFADGLTRLAEMLFPLLEATSDAFLSCNYQEAVQLRQEAETFAQCIRLWLQPPSKKDQLKRRLRNALLLMTEADAASHAAVKLALSCAAIEAIAVKKGSDTGITQAFSDNCAALLQPDAAKRIDTVRQIKKLYAGRSDLIHGNTIEEQPNLAHQAWLLAAGVIRAVMQWMRMKDLPNESLQDEQFFESLEIATRTAKPMDGVSPLLVQCLPGGLR